MEIKRRDIPSDISYLKVAHPILQRVYAARGVTTEAELDKQLQTLHPFHTLKDIDRATHRLEQALQNQERILIIGDFDADGATSTALAVSALRAMGAKFVEFLVPNRFEFGYGLTPDILEVAKKWQPQLIITVDNGIASIDGVLAANASGIDVLITDHHLAGDVLPQACAIVNPNQPGDIFPSKSIAGVGVIFYVMLALRRHLIQTGWFEQVNIKEPNMAQFLDLVALGTVADVVGLDQNNRILVNQGLLRIRQGLCRSGIQALAEVSGRAISSLRESDLGFALAPRLNAAGRLDDMSLGIECLLCDNLEKAHRLAQHLDDLNHERRHIESEMKAQAVIVLNKLKSRVDKQAKQLPLALCLVDKSWHQGVIGILAGRLKDIYHRPVIIFAVVGEDELKGSARSIASLNIRDALDAVDKRHPELIKKFGGHAMAAGLSIHPKSFDAFHQAFLEEVARHIDSSHCQSAILSDGALEISDMNLELAHLLQQSGPWGQQFPEPVFDNIFEVLDQRLVGQKHLKLSVALPQSQLPIDAIAFNVDLQTWPNYRARHIHAAYKLDINIYQGRTSLQLVMIAMNVST